MRILLRQVIDGAAKVLASAQSRNDRPIHNFILVPLHDPGALRVFDALQGFYHNFFVPRMASSAYKFLR